MILRVFPFLVMMAVAEAQKIDKLFLINTVTNANLGPITNGTIIRLGDVGSKLTLQANVVTPAGSVVFDMDGKLRVRVENGAPYTLAGDTGGVVYNPSTALVQPGAHTVSATAYQKTKGTGLSGPKFTIQFTTSNTKTPTRSPTRRPTRSPTNIPTRNPTRKPTTVPSKAPIQNTISPPTRSPTKAPVATALHYCGCPSCTEEVWNRMASGYSCGSRITWVMSALQKSEREACMQVANEFPTICQPCGTCTPTAPSPVVAPIPATAPSPVTPPVPTGGGSSTNKCGGAVNTGGTSFNTCTRDLWNPTGDATQHCYAYGGASDPCSLHNNNDAQDGLFKNPSACTGDTFYLWDEPDTQGKDYTWAGVEWAKYATRFSTEIMALRAKGVRFTSPLLRAGGTGTLAANLNTFYTACGSACQDPNSPAYININAINAFVGPWNRAGRDGCLDAANFITNEIKSYIDNRGRPWFVTNWSRIGTSDVNAQVDAMSVIGQFFGSGSPVQRIYWFGATDYGGNSQNNFLTTQLVSNGVTTTLGQIWKSNCNTL